MHVDELLIPCAVVSPGYLSDDLVLPDYDSYNKGAVDRLLSYESDRDTRSNPVPTEDERNVPSFDHQSINQLYESRLAQVLQMYVGLSENRRQLLLSAESNRTARETVERGEISYDLESARQLVMQWKSTACDLKQAILAHRRVLRSVLEAYYDLMDVLHRELHADVRGHQAYNQSIAGISDPSAFEAVARSHALLHDCERTKISYEQHHFDPCVVCRVGRRDLAIEGADCHAVSGHAMCRCVKEPYCVCKECFARMCAQQWMNNFVASLYELGSGGQSAHPRCLLSCPVCNGAICPYNAVELIDLVDMFRDVETTSRLQDGITSFEQPPADVFASLSQLNHMAHSDNDDIQEDGMEVGADRDGDVRRLSDVVGEALRDNYQIMKVIQERVLGREHSRRDALPDPLGRKKKRDARCSECNSRGHYAPTCPLKDMLAKNKNLAEVEQSVRNAFPNTPM